MWKTTFKGQSVRQLFTVLKLAFKKQSVLYMYTFLLDMVEQADQIRNKKHEFDYEM